MGPTWGPSGADRTQVGPILAPWTLLSGDLYSLNGKTSHRKFLWSLEAVRLDVMIILSLRNFTSISAALLPRRLSNFRAMVKPESRGFETSRDLAIRRLTVWTWWRHQMEIFSALLALCAGKSPVSGEFTAQRPVTRSFDVFFDLRLIKRLSKHSRGWWFETLSRPLWRHCTENRGTIEMTLKNISKIDHPKTTIFTRGLCQIQIQNAMVTAAFLIMAYLLFVLNHYLEKSTDSLSIKPHRLTFIQDNTPSIATAVNICAGDVQICVTEFSIQWNTVIKRCYELEVMIH